MHRQPLRSPGFSGPTLTARLFAKLRPFRLVALIALTASGWGPTAATLGQEVSIKNICRIKGQEENVLRGIGLVVGLNGTGEAGHLPTMRALARSMEIMGSPLTYAGVPTTEELDELKQLKNVAMVMVTAIVPGTGARRGDKVDCHVAAITGKSLSGGRLAFAALQGPNTLDNRVYALAQGPIHLDDPDTPLVGRVHHGAQFEQDIFNPYFKDGKVTLVINRNHADFDTASSIAELIRTQNSTDAIAIDAANVEVAIPDEYAGAPAAFVAAILDRRVYIPAPEARVVVNERTGSIVISGNVNIGPVVVTHRNLVVETVTAPGGGAGTASERFVAVADSEASATRLQSLLDALNALKVPPQDVIEIIKGIDRNGKLHAKLIIE